MGVFVNESQILLFGVEGWVFFFYESANVVIRGQILSVWVIIEGQIVLSTGSQIILVGANLGHQWSRHSGRMSQDMGNRGYLVMRLRCHY